MRDVLITVAFLVVAIACIVGSVLYNQASDFFGEQMPGADSVGEQIAMQYSQLRDMSVALDDLACRVEINEAAQADMVTRFGDDEITWPSDMRAEARNLRYEHTTLLQMYSKTAAEYNELLSDIRTLPDDLGLQVDDIPQAEAMSPFGVCNAFALP